MNEALAKRFIDEYYDEEKHSETSLFLLRESLEYLYRSTLKAEYVLELGGTYYSDKEFDLAEHYYKIAVELGNINAVECLGYVYYYGRTGKPDYKKAFFCFKEVMEKTGDIEATYKVADMYRNGYYVEQNQEKYEEIIESLYPKVKDDKNLSSLLPEVFSRLGQIRIRQGRNKEARALFLQGREFLAQRMEYSSFFGEATTMRFLVQGLFEVADFDQEGRNLYDLYDLAKTPCRFSFSYEGDRYTVKINKEKNSYPLLFDGKWFESPTDFYYRGTLDGKLIRSCYEDIYGIEVTYE